MIENFEKLSFERKIDVLVAQHVFNMKDIKIKEHIWDYMGESGVGWVCFYPTGSHVACYSKLLTSAWDIVRKFDYLYLFRAKDFKGGQWECKLVDKHAMCDYDDIHDVYYAWAETEQLAICYAGLKAVGFDVKGFLKGEGKG